mmetsp:Transcript_6750/g.19875  ORF Transcript_6750/g.19875 Transcript_6750/m.19875 type:complete len:251 (+) Transcript_6750:106-858(+)
MTLSYTGLLSAGTAAAAAYGAARAASPAYPPAGPLLSSASSCDWCVARMSANSSLEAKAYPSWSSFARRRLSAKLFTGASGENGSPPGEAALRLSDALVEPPSQGVRGVIAHWPESLPFELSPLELKASPVTAVVSWLIGGCPLRLSCGLHALRAREAQASGPGSWEARPPSTKRGSHSSCEAVGLRLTSFCSSRSATSRSSAWCSPQRSHSGSDSITLQARPTSEFAVKGRLSVQSSKQMQPRAHMSTW